MEETVKHKIVVLIRNIQKEIISIRDIKKTALKHEDYSKVIICNESIFHKTKFIDQLINLL